MTNATEGEIYKALWLRLDSLRPQWDLKKLGVDFEPKSKPWMELSFLPKPEAEFAGFGNGRFTRERYLFQVDCHYPKIERRSDALFDRAEAVKTLFWPAHGRGLSIAVDSGALLDFSKMPQVGPLFEKGDSHLKLNVTVGFSTQWSPAAT